MTSFRTMACALALSAGPVAAQYVATPQAISGYPALTNPQTIVLTAPNSVSDRGRAEVALPFTFQFYNRQYTAITVTANGMAFFEQSTSPTDDFPSNVAIPSTNEPNGVIAPFWEDLDGNNGTSVLRQQIVAGPNGQGVAIEWKDWNRRFGVYTLTFQIRLWENGVIEFFYGVMQGSGQAISASIGIEAPTGAQGTNALPAGSCLHPTQTITLPDGGVGRAPSFAHCDLSSFDPQNTGSPITYVRFGPPPGVDLQPTSLRVTGIAQAGNDLQVSTEVSIRNFGTVASSAFGYRLYLSEDTLFDPPSADAGVADVEIVSGAMPPGPFTLVPNASVTHAVTGVAARPTSGSFYVLLSVDDGNSVIETNEVNNVLATSTPYFAGVDLVAESTSGPPSAGPGDPVTIRYAVTNQGFDPAGVVPFKFFLSRDTVFSTDDREVYSGTRMVAGGENVQSQVTFTLPATIPAEDYHVLFVVDDGPSAGTVVEVSDANNQVFSRDRMLVRQADLFVERIRIARPVTPFETATAGFFGEPIRVEATVRNQGGASAPNVSVVFFMSDNETLNGLGDPVVCDDGPFSLAPGEARAIAKSCTVPTRSVTNQVLTRGPFFFFAAAVAAGLAETNPSNNFIGTEAVFVRTPAPNLLPINLRGPTRMGPGEAFAVTRTLTNNGNRAAPASSYRYVLSANTIMTADDLVLPIVTATGDVNERQVTLAVDARDTATEVIRVPLGVTPATYYLGVLMDPQGLIDEVDTVDNGLAGPLVEISAGSLVIAPSVLPDAIMGQPYRAELSLAGATGAMTFSLANPAELPAGLAVSADGIFSGTPTALGAYAVTVNATAQGKTVSARLGLKVSRSTASLVLADAVLPPPARLIPYDFQLGAKGGVSPYRFVITTGILPEGLELTERGRLVGTPSGALGTASEFTLSVVDAVGNVDARVLVLTVVDASPFRILNASLPNGVFGAQYLADIAAENTSGAPISRPVRWTVLDGTLPPGLVLEESVTERLVISGAPTSSGLFQFRLQARDAQGREDSVTYGLFIGSAGLSITGALPARLDRGGAINATLNTTATVTDGTFFVLDGQLPPGVSLDAQGHVTGTVEAEAPYRSFTVNVGYGPGRERVVTMRTFRIDVEPPGTGVGRTCSVTGGAELGLLALVVVALRRRRAKA